MTSRLMKKYVNYLTKEKKLSENTVSSYMRDIRQLQEYAADSGITDLCDITHQVLVTYIIYMQRAGKAASSITRGIVSIRSFFNFAVIMGYVEQDPSEGLEVPKSEEHSVSILTQEEIKSLLNYPKAVDFKGYRDKAMLELLYATGIKVSELIAIRMDEVEIADSYIICGKGSRRRAVPMGEMAQLAVSRYIEHARARQLVEKQDPELFLNLNGQALTRQGFWKILKDYKTKANISSDITPHTLRHTFAMHMIENGTEIRDVQTMLGNNSGSSSAMYKKMLDKRIAEVYKKAHPRANKK